MDTDRLKVFFLMLFVGTSSSAACQASESDSGKIISVVSEFYTWYFDQIRNDRFNEFNPSFVKAKDGMTTLDFKNYKLVLKRNSFDQDYIEKQIETYQACLLNLNKIPYKEFLAFQDLDDFESINCAFSNVFKWIPGMEPFDKIRIHEVNFVNESSSFVKVSFFNLSSEQVKSSATIYLVKKKKKWLINEIII